MDKNKKITVPGLLRTAIYIRVSTDQQAKNGDSIGEQTETLTAYVNGRDDLILSGMYIDDGISGQKINRDGFTRLIGDVCAGRIDLIVFTKLDRWFRSLRHYLNAQATLEEHGVNWLAVSQPFFDTSTPHGRAFIANSMSFAELEAQNDSERIRAVFDHKYKHGEVLSGKVPLGFSIVDKHLSPNDDAAKVLAIFQRFSRSGSLNDTVRFIESEYGIVMSISNLKKAILTNAKYIGIFRDNANYCPAIIPQELFDDVQRKLTFNVKISQKHTYIFSGLVRCACCGSAASGFQHRSSHSGVVYRYSAYRCRQAFAVKRCHNKKIFIEKSLETYVLQHIKPELQKAIISYEVAAAPAADQKQKRALITRKIEKLKELYVNDLISLEEYKVDKAAYTAQLDELPVETAPEKDLTALQRFLALDLDTVYTSMTPEEKRYLWRSVIKEIRVDEQRNVTIIFL